MIITYSLGSWTFPKSEVELELFNDGFDTELYLDACPYVVSHPTAVIAEKSYEGWGVFQRLDINFDLEPRPAIEHHGETLGEKRASRGPRLTVRKDWHSDKCVWPRCKKN